MWSFKLGHPKLNLISWNPVVKVECDLFLQLSNFSDFFRFQSFNIPSLSFIFWDFLFFSNFNFLLFLHNIVSQMPKFFSTFYDWLTLKVNESRMWSFPSLSFNFLRSSAKGESGSTLMIFTFHSYRESFTSSTWNIINKLENWWI